MVATRICESHHQHVSLLSLRPLTDRDYIIVQDYVRVLGRTDGNDDGHNWFFTYNHDFEHPYFAPRPDFVRSSVRYQGMVGVLGDSGKTRLTWLVNYDFGGLIPSSFSSQMLLSLMSFPVATIEAVKKGKQQSSVLENDDDARGESGGDGAKAEASVSNTSALLETIAELKAQRKKDALMVAGLKEENSTLQEENSTLRRRLARRRAGEGEEHHDE